MARPLEEPLPAAARAQRRLVKPEAEEDQVLRHGEAERRGKRSVSPDGALAEDVTRPLPEL